MNFDASIMIPDRFIADYSLFIEFILQLRIVTWLPRWSDVIIDYRKRQWTLLNGTEYMTGIQYGGVLLLLAFKRGRWCF